MLRITALAETGNEMFSMPPFSVFAYEAIMVNINNHTKNTVKEEIHAVMKKHPIQSLGWRGPVDLILSPPLQACETSWLC